MLVNPVSYLLIVMFSLVEVHAQVCFSTRIVTSSYIGTYAKTYRDKYGFGILKTKAIVKWFTKLEVKESRYCCKGYSKEYENEEASEKNCKPICNSNCTNGYCQRLEECGCNPGYRKINDTCVPSWQGNGDNGTYAAPNKFVCKPGYNLVNNTCQPVCTKPCHNGTCTYPETCVCYRGYKTEYGSPNNQCKPHCPSGCPYNSYCDSPGICKCNPGWHFIGNKRNICLPECKYPCGNGTCVFPNVCFCHVGFKMNLLRHRGLEVGPVCEPICKECEDVNCVVPMNSTKCVGVHATAVSDDTTTTTNIPFKTKSTHHYFNVSGDTTTSTTTTIVPYVVSSSSTERVVGDDVNDVHTYVTSGDPIEKSWMQKHGMFIWIPVAVLVATGVILLLVWQRIPVLIINYFKRKSYNVQGAFLKRNLRGSFENLQFLSNETVTQN